MTIEAGAAGIDLQAPAKHQLCVPAVTIRGDSYRLREKRRSGLLKAGTEPDPQAKRA
jgi:hypothetical protein